MAAKSVAELPEGDEWLYGLKLDGSPYAVVVINEKTRSLRQSPDRY
jgi:hypothetical protein